MILSADHEAIVTRALANVPADLHDAVRKYAADRLRPIREVEATDVRAAVAAALQRHRQ